MTAWVTKRMLIYGTTYPELSRTNFETVCTGAIDEETGGLIRIYPVSLRHMEQPFHLFEWIEAKVHRNTSDNRPESFKVDQQSVKVVGSIPAENWGERSRWVLHQDNIVESVEALWQQQKATSRSLALVKPRQVRRIYARRKTEAERKEWDEKRAASLAVRDLWVDVESTTKDLVFMPVEYKMDWLCHGPNCRGHDMTILDWGIYVLSRRMYAKARTGARDQAAQAKVIEALERAFDTSKRDPYVFLGNTKAHQGNFIIGGIYSPPNPPPQLTLL